MVSNREHMAARTVELQAAVQHYATLLKQNKIAYSLTKQDILVSPQRQYSIRPSLDVLARRITEITQQLRQAQDALKKHAFESSKNELHSKLAMQRRLRVML